MAVPGVKISPLDVETGTYQSAGNHGVTYPAIVAVAGLTAGGSGSQTSSVNTTITTGSKTHGNHQ
jgi:hypothetical protein